jgi:hypothetical protein
MSKSLEEKINNAIEHLKEIRKFKNKKVKSAFEKIDVWRCSSRDLFKEYCKKYKGHFSDAYAEKERLTFNNEFEYFPGISGEYILLTKDLLSIFTKGRISIFIKDFPIFVQLKSAPVFWINGGIITLWNFYFPISRIDTEFKEVLQFSDKLAVFPRLEFTFLNFIQTYSSKPNYTLMLSSLKQKNPQLLDFLEKYLTKNFWIIPETDIKTINPFCSIFLKDNTLLPCIPFRIVFKILECYKGETIYILGTKIECIEIQISYLNSFGEIRKDIVYFPIKMMNISPEREKIYNGLLFTFIDLDKEWIFPILFSFYEEDLHSYELFQELLLLFFKKRYLESKSLCSIEFKEDECWNEIEYLGTQLWKKNMLPSFEDTFMRLEKEDALKLIFSGLYPILVNSKNKIFFVPPPLGLLNLSEEQLKKFIEWYDIKSWNLSDRDFIEVKDIIPFLSFSIYKTLARDLKRKALYLEYLKKMMIYMRGKDYERKVDRMLS